MPFITFLWYLYVGFEESLALRACEGSLGGPATGRPGGVWIASEVAFRVPFGPDDLLLRVHSWQGGELTARADQQGD